MRIVPSLPPPLTVTEDSLAVEALTHIKPSKPVQARTLPPMVVQQRARLKTTSDISEQQEQRHDTHIHGERRTYCRRFEHLPILDGLRLKIDRRRHKQREKDMTEHVDEEV